MAVTLPYGKSLAQSAMQSPAAPLAQPAPATALMELPAPGSHAPTPVPQTQPAPENAPADEKTKPTMTSPASEQATMTQVPHERVLYKPQISTSNLQTGQQLLDEPIRFDNSFSIMFSEQDMTSVIMPGLALYDKAAQQMATGKSSNSDNKDDLTGLLESLQVQGAISKPAETPLPNLYLGSIAYYSPGNWSIWINGKKLLSRLNEKTNVIYVKSITRSEVSLVWKPPSLQDLGKLWNERYSAPNTPPANIKVDEASGTVMLTMLPNQTFVSHQLQISEGLIKQSGNAIAAPPVPVTTAPAYAPAIAKQPMSPVVVIPSKLAVPPAKTPVKP